MNSLEQLYAIDQKQDSSKHSENSHAFIAQELMRVAGDIDKRGDTLMEQFLLRPYFFQRINTIQEFRRRTQPTPWNRIKYPLAAYLFSQYAHFYLQQTTKQDVLPPHASYNYFSEIPSGEFKHPILLQLTHQERGSNVTGIYTSRFIPTIELLSGDEQNLIAGMQQMDQARLLTKTHPNISISGDNLDQAFLTPRYTTLYNAKPKQAAFYRRLPIESKQIFELLDRLICLPN